MVGIGLTMAFKKISPVRGRSSGIKISDCKHIFHKYLLLMVN